MFTVTEILDLAIQLETNGEGVYRDAAPKAGRKETAAMLGWMADEESRHLEFFRKLRREAAAKDANPVMEELKRDVFADILDKRSFSLEDRDLGRMETSEEVLRTALEFERDTVLFYEILEPFLVDEEARSQLRSIIEEEHRHIREISAHLASTEEQPA